MADIPREILAAILVNKLSNPSGCWSDYNRHFRAIEALNRLANPRQDSLVKPEEVPDEPDPNDFDNLDC
tara:strand:+ start:99055 stop:99261 length:207 start_codon:yes stop_codon:yes gene_type:complete